MVRAARPRPVSSCSLPPPGRQPVFGELPVPSQAAAAYARTLIDWIALVLCMRADLRTPASTAGSERRLLAKSLSFETNASRARLAASLRRTSSNVLAPVASAGRLTRQSSRDDGPAAVAERAAPYQRAGVGALAAGAVGSAALDLAMVGAWDC